jgi:tRNA G37 N-methylase Trm5
MRKVVVIISVTQPPENLSGLAERFAFRRLRTAEARKDLEYILDKFKGYVKISPPADSGAISPVFVVEGNDEAISYLKDIAKERNIIIEEDL